jgi:hypothetical protein
VKHCHRCKIDNPKASLFCLRCGNSFGARYCPRLHPNPLSADYCQACGSSDLSTADKPAPWSTARILLLLALAFLALTLAPSILPQGVDASLRQIAGIFIVAVTAAGALVWWSSTRHDG